MKLITGLVVLAVLYVGLVCGYRIGAQAEAHTHRLYIASLNQGDR